MQLEYVSLHVATSEDKKAQGGWLYAAAACIPWKFVQFWGTVQYIRSVDDLLQWKEPAALKMFYHAQNHFGFKPEQGIVSVRPTIFGDHYSVSDKLAIDAMFRFQRNDPDGFFAPGKGVTILAKFLMECFPGTTMDDCILTCGPESTNFLHGVLQNKLKKKVIKECIGLIREEAKKSLESLPYCREINFTHEAQAYLSRVFGRILFDDPNAGQALARYIAAFKSYITRQSSMVTLFKKAIGFDNKEEVEAIKNMQAKVREIIDAILDREDEIELFHGVDKEQFSRAKKQMMIFVALFAAQDNTSTLLSAAIYELAQLPDEGKAILSQQVRHHASFGENGAFTYPFAFHQFFANVLKKYPPVLGVARSLTKDVCMEYTVKGDPNLKKVIFPAGSSLSARIVELAEKSDIPEKGPSDSLYNAFSPFGSGKHRCPGESLAVAEIEAYLYHLICNYEIVLSGDYELQLKLQFTGVLEPETKAVLYKKI